MNSRLMNTSNSVQGFAEELGNSSPRFSHRRHSQREDVDYLSNTPIHYNIIVRSFYEYYDNPTEIINYFVDHVLHHREDWDVHLRFIGLYTDESRPYLLRSCPRVAPPRTFTSYIADYCRQQSSSRMSRRRRERRESKITLERITYELGYNNFVPQIGEKKMRYTPPDLPIELIHNIFDYIPRDYNIVSISRTRHFLSEEGFGHWYTYRDQARTIGENMRQHSLHMSRICSQIEYNNLTRYVMKPQIGLEILSASNIAYDHVKTYVTKNFPKYAMRELEGIISLLICLSQQTTITGAVSAIHLYLRSYIHDSLYDIISDYIADLLSINFEKQLSETTDDKPAWLSCFGLIKENWKLCKENKAFRQVSKLLGVLISVGLCHVSRLTFTMGTFKLFEPHIFSKHATAFDLLDAVFESVAFFVESMYMCFKTKSVVPLLVTDRSALELDEEFSQITAMWELVKVGNLKRVMDVSDQEFENRLEKLATKLKALIPSLKGFDKKIVTDKFSKCLNIKNDFITHKISSGIRRSPFAIEVFGESSQGKTTMADQLVDALLVSAGLPTDKSYRAAYNPGDKFMSNWTSDKLVLIFDDIANEKEKYVERPPTRAVLEVCNNQMAYANKAELEAKGKCFIEPEIVVATTNKKNLDAGSYSNCPYSIQRRFHCITVKVRPEFRKIVDGVDCGVDSTKVRESYTVDGVYKPPAIDDIWLLTIEQAIKPPSMHLIASYQPVEYRGKFLCDVPMKVCVQYFAEEYKKHRMNQDALIDGMRARQTSVEKCSFDGCPHICGMCPEHDLNKQVGYQLNFNFSEYVLNWSYLDLIPQCLYQTNSFHALVTITQYEDIKSQSEFLWRCFGMFCVFSLLFGWYFVPLIIFGFVYCILNQAYILWKAKQNALSRIQEFSILSIIQRHKIAIAKYVCATTAALALLYAGAKGYRTYREKLETQGSLRPVTQADVDTRDKENNVWTQVVQKTLPISDVSKCVAPAVLASQVHKNLVYGTVHKDGKHYQLNGLFLDSNILMIPTHYFDYLGDSIRATFRKKNPNCSGGKFAVDLSRNASVAIENRDLSICYCATGGSFVSLVKHFPLQHMPSVPFELHYRDFNGELQLGKGLLKPGLINHGNDVYGGLYRNFTMNTFNGLCGSVLISQTVGSVICGMHVAGKEGTNQGGYASITQCEVIDAIQEVREFEGVIKSGSAGKFEKQVLGIDILTHEPLHPKSPLNYMPEDSQVEYYGTCVGRTVSKTDVQNTPISPFIEEVCGVPNIYRGPKMNPDWYGWQSCLANLAIPAHPYEYDLLKMAIQDYKDELMPLFNNSLWNDAKPLNDHENLCGIPGKKFIDAINLDTSMGFPLTGPKRPHVTELEPTLDKPNNREFSDEVMKEIRRCEDLYKQGFRAYAIAKACKKDEIHSKDKCRVFYGNPIALTYLVRKYYLPILRVLQMNPLSSECAVGINCHGPEWDEFYKFVSEFGKDRLFGGDYGKYDQKIPSQLIFAALRILIDFAKVCNYTEQDLNVMEAMTGDIVYALIAFNGDLIGLTEGTHISGNSLTVIINGICGSLNLRCLFYKKHPFTNFESRRKFRDFVHVMTYGDDNIGSVHPDEDDFNIKSVSEFLDIYGQIYTMPDKESDLTEFLPEEEFEFLKRKSIYHEKLGSHVGALIDKSIFKSLHCYLRPKGCVLSKEQACAVNIDGALREWFNHGEETYEMRRKQMLEVANRANISHMCNNLYKSYDDFVEEWRENYAN